MNQTDSLWSIYEFVCVSDLIAMLWAGTCFASIAFGYPQTHFWGVPQTPGTFLAVTIVTQMTLVTLF